LTLLRPVHGTDARDYDQVVGAQVVREIPAFQAIVRGEDYS